MFLHTYTFTYKLVYTHTKHTHRILMSTKHKEVRRYRVAVLSAQALINAYLLSFGPSHVTRGKKSKQRWSSIAV